MNPASRNRVLMIGGALVVIALLLVCGPLEGQFGAGKPSVEATPEVSAAPPEEPEIVVLEVVPEIDPAEAIAGLIPGATTGAVIGESDLRGDVLGEAPDSNGAPMQEISKPAPPPIRVVQKASPKKTVAKAPAVSAKGPAIPEPIVSALPTPEELAREAVREFDESLPDVLASFDDATAADRFAPPVDSGPRVSPIVSAAQGFNTFALRPCDSPGAGCRNVVPRRLAKPVPFSGASELTR